MKLGQIKRGLREMGQREDPSPNEITCFCTQINPKNPALVFPFPAENRKGKEEKGKEGERGKEKGNSDPQPSLTISGVSRTNLR